MLSQILLNTQLQILKTYNYPIFSRLLNSILNHQPSGQSRHSHEAAYNNAKQVL
jgi:hypothetical protein